MKNERILNSFVNDGILFELVEKQETIFAGKLGYAPGLNDEPDIGRLLEQFRKIMPVLAEAADLDWGIGISINYRKNGAYKGYMFAAEVESEQQSEESDVIKVPASHYLKISKAEKRLKKIRQRQLPDL